MGRETHEDSQRQQPTPQDPFDCTQEAVGVAQACDGEQGLLEEERSTQGHGERPSDDTTNSKPCNARSCSQTSSPIHEGSGTKHTRVHGETRREVCGTGMKVAGTQNQRDDE